MVELAINDKQTYLLKEKWEELTPVELVKVIAVLMNPYKNKDALKLALFFVLIGETPERFERLIGGSDNDYVLLQIVEEVFPVLETFLAPMTSTKNMVPEFELEGVMYKGPSDALIDQTGEEMMLTHHAMAMYKSNAPDTEKFLDLVIAINYHPLVDKKRTLFIEDDIQKHVDRIKRLSPVIKKYLLLWLDNCEAAWQAKYPWLFSDNQNPNRKASDVDPEAMRKIMFALAGHSLGDTWDKVKSRSRQDIYFALDELDRQREENEPK